MDTSAESRLAAIYRELVHIGVPNLIMGGHAVRYYGVDRSTIDFDLVVSLPNDEWRQLPDRLARSATLAHAREGHSWRPRAFRRFVIGKLADGREERLEFWHENHLLAPFPELESRKEMGAYGGAELGFLGLGDLIRSKETEREDDWRDIRLLEEIADERRLARASDDESIITALASLCSQRGFAMAMQRGLLNGNAATRAVATARHPVTLALLAPYAAFPPLDDAQQACLQTAIRDSLQRVSPGAARHLALVEAVRRLYQRLRMAEDRADKERTRSA